MDIERARFNMIEQQIRPWDVLEQSVLDVLARIKREQFVPQALQNLAFTDMDIPLTLDTYASGQHMLAPKVEARLLQALAPKAHEHCLLIGAGSGHTSALVATLCKQVSSYEADKKLAAFATNNLQTAKVINAQVVHANAASPGAIAGDQFDLIFFTGSLELLPPRFESLLAAGGRMIAIQGSRPVMKAILSTKSDSGSLKHQVLFETLADPLTGFVGRSKFEF
jgi:protein-L-isoaspartate(D-aspartate) O-methyltransferase